MGFPSTVLWTQFWGVMSGTAGCGLLRYRGWSVRFRAHHVEGGGIGLHVVRHPRRLQKASEWVGLVCRHARHVPRRAGSRCTRADAAEYKVRHVVASSPRLLRFWPLVSISAPKATDIHKPRSEAEGRRRRVFMFFIATFPSANRIGERTDITNRTRILNNNGIGKREVQERFPNAERPIGRARTPPPQRSRHHARSTCRPALRSAPATSVREMAAFVHYTRVNSAAKARCP